MGMAGDNMENNSLPNGDFEKSMDIEVESFYRSNCLQKQPDTLKTKANQSKIHFLKTESNAYL